MPFEIDFEDQRIGFAAAHFIIGHDKCGRLHGHNYFIKVSIQGELDKQNMVLDYGVLREELNRLVKPLDHHVLIPSKAKELEIKESDNTITIITCGKRYLIPKEDTIFLPIPATTSEELARYFHQKLKEEWPKYKIKVTIEEAPGATATYSD